MPYVPWWHHEVVLPASGIQSWWRAPDCSRRVPRNGRLLPQHHIRLLLIVLLQVRPQKSWITLKKYKSYNYITKLITSINNWNTRRVREAIEIHRHDTIPQDPGLHINNIWIPLLQQPPLTHATSPAYATAPEEHSTSGWSPPRPDSAV